MNEITRARQRARRLYKSPRFQGAYVAGATSASLGQSATRCPYARDDRKTWLAVYRRAWMRGYESVPPRM